MEADVGLDVEEDGSCGVDGDSDAGPRASALHTIDVPRQAAGTRLDRFLAGQLGDASRTRIQRWIQLGAVRVDGRMCLPRYRLRGFERIEAEPQPLQAEQAWQPEAVPLQVVHVDDDVIVVNKTAGLVTHPAPGHWGGTLLNGLLHAFPETASLPRAGVVHRLDMGTTGVMVCARSERAFVSLSAQLALRSMHRLYVAIARGSVRPRGSVEAPIGRDPRQRLRMAVVTGDHGRPARTDWRLLGAAGEGGNARSALLCKLHTGRTHQIRVHLAHLGHPLVGDVLYGGHRDGINRPALHSWQLAFEHPDGAATRSFEAPLPDDLQALAGRCGLDLNEAGGRAPAWTSH